MKNRGLSLIEVGIAIAILAVFLLSLLGIFQQGYLYLLKAKLRVPAHNIARAVLETYLNWTALDSLDGVTNGNVTNGTYASPPDPVTLSLFGKNYTYNVTLNISDGPLADVPHELKQLNVTVTYGGGSFSLYSLKAREAS
jgi:prepilin-type N-terminal cleavage/methylation domain-containing protein